MTTYTFSNIDILNASLTSQEGSLSYRTKSVIGFKGRKTTTLTSTAAGDEKIVGGIDWRERTFVIHGKEWDLANLKSKPSGMYKTMRSWDWAGQTYKIKLHNKQWTATSTTSLTPVAIFTQHQSNIFRASRHASLYFATGMSEADKIFFMFVMIYSELRMQDETADGHLQGRE